MSKSLKRNILAKDSTGVVTKLCETHRLSSLVNDETVCFIIRKIQQQYFIHLAYRSASPISANTSEQSLYDYNRSKYGSELSFEEYKFLWMLNAFTEYWNKCCEVAPEIIKVKTLQGYFYADLLLALLNVFIVESKRCSYDMLIKSKALRNIMDTAIECTADGIFSMNREVTSTNFTDNSIIGQHTPILGDCSEYDAVYKKICSLIAQH